MAYPAYAPLLEITRGPIVESLHHGAVVICDTAGNLLAAAGDPNAITYLRSTAKPFQTLPLVENGGLEHFGLTEKELALTCASHSGTDEHAATAASIQQKVGVSEGHLLCGTHLPMHEATRLEMLRRGENPTPNRHNCSGKHSGMLAQCVLRGLSTEDYINPQHPIQQTILQTFAEMCSHPLDQIAIGVDGCSAPVFAVPMRNAALAFARLSDPSGLPAPRAAALRRIARAMMEYPNMVAGPDRFDTLVMTLAAGRLVTKAGAEGYQGMGLLPGALGPGSPALGIAIKVADGDQGGRAVTAIAIETLRQIGLLSAADVEAMPFLAPRPVRNWRKFEVGQIRSVFEIRLP